MICCSEHREIYDGDWTLDIEEKSCGSLGGGGAECLGKEDRNARLDVLFLSIPSFLPSLQISKSSLEKDYIEEIREIRM